VNAEHINPFIQGAQRVIDTICGERPNLGKVFIKNPPYKPQTIGVEVAIIGAITGSVVFIMEIDTGCYLASKMMMGAPVPELDPMSQSALCELANMISGNVATVFSEKGILTDITPPKFFNNSYPPLPTTVVCVPLLLQTGSVFEVDVCLQLT